MVSPTAVAQTSPSQTALLRGCVDLLKTDLAPACLACCPCFQFRDSLSDGHQLEGSKLTPKWPPNVSQIRGEANGHPHTCSCLVSLGLGGIWPKVCRNVWPIISFSNPRYKQYGSCWVGACLHDGPPFPCAEASASS